MDCLFCKIIKGEISSNKVYEDENVLAFLDIEPCSKGHTIVIPKKHFSSISEIGEKDWSAFQKGLKLVIEQVNSVLKPDGMNIGINDKKSAGQSVGHSHWHIIPRYDGDGGGSMHSIVKSKEKINIKDVAKKFIK